MHCDHPPASHSSLLIFFHNANTGAIHYYICQPFLYIKFNCYDGSKTGLYSSFFLNIFLQSEPSSGVPGMQVEHQPALHYFQLAGTVRKHLTNWDGLQQMKCSQIGVGLQQVTKVQPAHTYPHLLYSLNDTVCSKCALFLFLSHIFIHLKLRLPYKQWDIQLKSQRDNTTSC